MKDGKNIVIAINNQNVLAFFGKITASMTHEIKNVLAIIQETSGLIEDIVNMSDTADLKNKERFISSLERIQAQIQRGIHITSNLNRFAHSPDNEQEQIDLNDLIQQLSSLVTRFAHLKKVKLMTVPADSPLMIQANSVHLQMLIFNAIEIVLQHIESGTLTLIPIQENEQLKMHINYDLMTDEQFNCISGCEAWSAIQKNLLGIGIHIVLSSNPRHS